MNRSTSDIIGSESKPQRITVFHQNGSGTRKIAGIEEYGGDDFSLQIFDIRGTLPPIIDDTGDFLPERLDTDIVLDFLKHPDLSQDLAAMCRNQNIPMVASGKKIVVDGVWTPPT